MLKKLALGLVIGSASVGAFSQAFSSIQATSGNSAYLQDSNGAVIRSQDGSCWRTGHWTNDNAVPGCDGALQSPVPKATAPAFVVTPSTVVAVTPSTVVTAPPKRCDFAVSLVGDRTFATNRTVLTNAAQKSIDEDVIAQLASCASVDVVILTGHADRLGNPAQNQQLSQKRAEAVAAYLKQKGVGAPLEVHGAGSSQSVSNCDRELARKKLAECLSADRRVTVEVRGIAR